VPKELVEGRYEIKGIMEISVGALRNISAGWFETEVVNIIGNDWATKRGTWPKRVARRLHTLKVAINNNDLSKIGKIARESCISGEDYILYVKKRIDWRQGDYADDGSCYWNSKKDAKKMVVDAGGGALCLHLANDEKLARCWWVPWKNSYVLFNGYTMRGDNMSLTSFSRMVMDLTEMTYYRKVRLSNRGITSGLLWINSEAGFIVGNKDVQQIERVDLDILPYCHSCGERFEEEENIDDYKSYCDSCWDEDDNSVECYSCGRRVSEGDEYYVEAEDHYYCQHCYSERFSYCSNCDNDARRNRGANINGEFVCEECLDEYWTKCHECGKWVPNDEAIHPSCSDEGYCQECADELFVVCDKCGEDDWKEDTVYKHGIRYCYTCIRRYFEKCHGCREWTDRTELFNMADGNYCEHCVTRREEVA
jgi:hypothetical protein